MIFRHFMTSVNESNVFIVACPETREALMVDAGSFEPDMDEFLKENNLRLVKLFITHDHYDHTGGLAEIRDKFHPEIFAGRALCAGFKATRVDDGDTLTLGNLTGTVFDTSGHTPESRSLYIGGMVFTGDALFAGSVGGTSSPAEAKHQIDLIRKNIFSLPPETEIHTGHGPSSTVAIESRYNPFFQ